MTLKILNQTFDESLKSVQSKQFQTLRESLQNAVSGLRNCKYYNLQLSPMLNFYIIDAGKGGKNAGRGGQGESRYNENPPPPPEILTIRVSGSGVVAIFWCSCEIFADD